jgi:hypothetical protein
MLVTRIVGVALVISGLSATWPGPVSTAVGAQSTQDITFDQAGFRDEADVALAWWAFERFDQAGLDLPPLSLSFHDDRAACGGNFGYYHSGDPARIDICGFNRDRFLVTPKKTLLHELAHAWGYQTLDSEIRNRFLDLRGLHTWQDDSVSWQEHGTEHAAEVIAWGLMDEELFLTSISGTEPHQLAEAFVLLTGREPLR